MLNLATSRADSLQRKGCSFVKTRCNTGFTDTEVVEILAESKGPVQASITVVAPEMKLVIFVCQVSILYLLVLNLQQSRVCNVEASHFTCFPPVLITHNRPVSHLEFQDLHSSI